RLSASRAQAASLLDDGAALALENERLSALWTAQPLAEQAEQGGAEQGGADQIGADPIVAWFDQRRAQVAAQLAGIDAAEQAARAAETARDAAQHAFDEAGSAHTGAAELAASTRLAASAAQAALAALADQTARAAEALVALLDDLEGAFDSDVQLEDGMASFDFGFTSAGGWRAAWQNDPARFRGKRLREVEQFNAQASTQPERGAALGELQAQLKGAQAQAAQAAKTAEQALSEFARHDGDVAARRAQRALLWGGAAVAQVEAQLRQAVDGARAALMARQGAIETARLAAARARDKVVQNAATGVAVAAQAEAALSKLAHWLDGFGQRHPQLAPPDGIDALAELLAVPLALRQQEQAALAALENAASAARAVLEERRRRHAAHLEQAPPGELSTLADDLAQLAAERRIAGEAATALRLQLAQDDVRRHNAQAAMAAIEGQQLVERRWGKLSELIGSADGKKFRNYAQQFTLDVLLGYANAHLAHLARRYRLERVGGGAGPSLGLMVRDQDMGGEVRGVNSLSGGESFLVSLALALGLASLSSNRVKVESLFIDEGFGSLDSETLRVAMDALDGLQAMGRKVGVISHVQEMTERIATRIIVQPSGGGSSSVMVE
ncbi:MAG: exonuclease SbcC, partial [Massilia sp.]|nr:exonuclease SbcC [Massilia sp.]